MFQEHNTCNDNTRATPPTESFYYLFVMIEFLQKADNKHYSPRCLDEHSYFFVRNFCNLT